MKRFIKAICLLALTVICMGLCSCSSGSGSYDLFEFTFELDGISYTLPESITAFTDNGWTFPEDFDEFDSTVKPGNLESTYLEQGDNWFNIEIFNYGDEDKALKDCPIGRVTYNFSGDIEVVSAGGFKLNGKTLDEVVKKYGKPLSQADYSTYTEIIYDKDPSTGIYDRYTFRFDKDTKVIKHIDIIYFYGE